jgi:hypothetical protein
VAMSFQDIEVECSERFQHHHLVVPRQLSRERGGQTLFLVLIGVIGLIFLEIFSNVGMSSFQHTDFRIRIYV